MKYKGKIVPALHSDVVLWAHRAARERVSLKDARNTTWYWAPGLGCAGLMAMKGKARIKGVYVVKDHRGEGIGTALIDRLEAEAVKLEGAAKIEVYAHNPSFYEARGYAVVGANQFGVPLLRRDL